jgi:four helix bundle protein
MRNLCSMAPYEKLRAWQETHQLVLNVYGTTESWPSRELYGLTSQARRAAFSIAANISEGVAKRGQREFRRFLDMALGSMSELSYILLVARELGLLDKEKWESLDAQRNRAGKLLWRLYEAVQRRAQTQDGR